MVARAFLLYCMVADDRSTLEYVEAIVALSVQHFIHFMSHCSFSPSPFPAAAASAYVKVLIFGIPLQLEEHSPDCCCCVFMCVDRYTTTVLRSKKLQDMFLHHLTVFSIQRLLLEKYYGRHVHMVEWAEWAECCSKSSTQQESCGDVRI